MQMHRGLWLCALVAAAVPLVRPGAAQAQAIPFSQHGTVSQRVGVTDIDLAYNRPTARGRQLFPGVVAWERIWNPGADSATRIRFSTDVLVEDVAVAAGEYSVWVIPRAEGPWGLILHRASRVFHTPYPGEAGELMRVPVVPGMGDHMETLAFYFPVVTRHMAVLHLHWGRTVLPIRIQTPASP
jgi:hypothetical protein